MCDVNHLFAKSFSQEEYEVLINFYLILWHRNVAPMIISWYIIEYLAAWLIPLLA